MRESEYLRRLRGIIRWQNAMFVLHALSFVLIGAGVWHLLADRVALTFIAWIGAVAASLAAENLRQLLWNRYMEAQALFYQTTPDGGAA